MEKAAWPAEKVEWRSLADLKPYDKNARTHSEEQVAQIAASITEWGWTTPILVDEANGILAGHGRALAAAKLGAGEVPVIVARDWTAAQKRAYVLADNKLAENAGWNADLLKIEFGALQDLGFDLGLTGFSSNEIALALAGGLPGADPEATPDPEAVAASQLGDVWLLGGHRLVCGDSTDEAAVRAAVGQEKPHLMVTDPPYGVDYDPAWRSRVLKDGAKRAEGKVKNDHEADWRSTWALFPGAVAYIWHAGQRAKDVAISLEESGFEIRAQIIWGKSRFVLSRGHYHPQHEPCWYAVRKGGKGEWQGDRTQSTLWTIDHRKSETGHGTQKPVECMRRPIVNNSKPGDAVYDPFLGSGTTLIAAEMEGRRCFGIELNPVYVDVIIKRWQQFTGKVATLEATGETLEERGRKVAA